MQVEPSLDCVYCDPDSALSTPPYSLLPGKSELSLHTQAKESEQSHLTWRFETRHMLIKLVTSRWGTSSPAYGLNGIIEGTITILGHHPDHIQDITVTLEGSFASAVLTNGSPIHENVVFMSHSIPINLSEVRHHGDEYPFSIPIPSEVDIQGVTTSSPPSFFRYQTGIVGEVNYALKVSLTRHGRSIPFKSDEIKNITLFYLPKSRPAEPALARIPKPLSERIQSPDLYVSEHVNTYPLIPYWPETTPSKQSSSGLEPFKKSIYFSIPAPQCYTSGDKIPFFLSLVFPNSPVQATMYSQNIHVALCKRMVLATPRSSLRKLIMRSRSRNSSKSNVLSLSDSHKSHSSTPAGSDDEDDHSDGVHSHSKSASSEILNRLPDALDASDSIRREWCISTAHLETRSEYSEGVHLLRGSLEAGDLGRECGWNIGSIAKVQHFIRVSVECPDHLKEHLPDFKLEQDVELTTDCWEASNRELCSMGGLPAPALGLVKDLSRDFDEI